MFLIYSIVCLIGMVLNLETFWLSIVIVSEEISTCSVSQLVNENKNS